MLILRFALIVGLLLSIMGLVRKIAPSKSKLMIIQDESHFPVVSGFNLNRQEFEFPRDFSHDYNLVILPFRQYQQQTVNTWIPFAQEIEGSYSGFVYYELPTIYEMPILSRTFLNEGMRAGIPDQTARERTITLYLDKGVFKSALGIPTEDDIYLLLVNRDGKILWRSTGVYTVEKTKDLLQLIQNQR